MIVKALSIKQPWAWLIVNGIKPVENRKWYTSYKGILFIHASKQFDYDGLQFIEKNYPGVFDGINGAGIAINKHDFECGGIVGRVRMIGCVKKHPSSFFSGPYGFVFTNARPVKFFECSGRLGLFDLSTKGR